MTESFIYTIKVWLTTAITPPLMFLFLCCCINPKDAASNIPLYCWILFVGLVVSFLTWVLLLIAVYNVLKLQVPVSRHKLLIQIFGLALTLSTFVLFAICFGSIYILGDVFFWIIVAPYMACFSVSIHFYQLPQLYTNHQENSTT